MCTMLGMWYGASMQGEAFVAGHHFQAQGNLEAGEIMKRVISLVILGLVVWGLAGCASTPQYQGAPSTQVASDNSVNLRVTPILDERYGINVGYTGMVLEVRNKTNQDMTINWDETFYLQGGTPNGGFSLGGETGARLRGFDVVFAQETYVKTIYPTILVDTSGIGTLTEPRLDNHKPMSAGENGIILKLRVGSEDILHRITFTIPG
jgi:hypothetical protein